MCRPNVSVSVRWLYLLLPSLLCEILDCYYSPVREKELEGMFEPTVTKCPPDEVCYKAEGRYGNYSALFALGCTLRRDCDQVDNIRYKGVTYTLNRTCCDLPQCNAIMGTTGPSLLLLITLAVTVGVM